MQSITTSNNSHSTANSKPAKLAVSLASTPQDIREVQRLRHRVLTETFQFSKDLTSDSLKIDEFDDYCDHLIVRDSQTSCVVGTYRVMSPTTAQRMGRYYCEQEFDLSRLNHLRQRITETGHACIHPAYRNTNISLLLWKGLMLYMRRERCDYLVDCTSVSLADGGRNATALHHTFAAHNFAPCEYRVPPHNPFPVHERATRHIPQIPPLLKGYLRSGAWVCGEPAWAHTFNAADFFILLPLSKLNNRHARYYLKADKPT